jgi:hypothetical protein
MEPPFAFTPPYPSLRRRTRQVGSHVPHRRGCYTRVRRLSSLRSSLASSPFDGQAALTADCRARTAAGGDRGSGHVRERVAERADLVEVGRVELVWRVRIREQSGARVDAAASATAGTSLRLPPSRRGSRSVSSATFSSWRACASRSASSPFRERRPDELRAEAVAAAVAPRRGRRAHRDEVRALEPCAVNGPLTPSR